MIACSPSTAQPRKHVAQSLDWKVANVFGLPLACITLPRVLDEIGHLIARREPSFLITANLHYAMLTSREPELQKLNQKAAMVLADGMPLVWASKLGLNHLPERVTGADLVPAICQQASENGHRVFFLGGAEGVGQAAAERLRNKFPGLQIVGIACPKLAELSISEEHSLIATIRSSGADILIAALGQPRGEQWIAKNLNALDVPVSIQVGASLDFAAGRVSRAPVWVQRSGLEWVYRFGCEPLRLGPRYLQNIGYLAKEITRTMLGRSREYV
jgi:N-acetylglucosaminyldiphosphoundecaprenol N-acetyl-beta-D-mannosaminyltransferase